MISRRDFIKLFSSTGAVLLAPLRGLGQIGEKDYLQEGKLAGDLYGGFLLLEEGAQVPEFIQYPTIPMPNGCGVGVDEKNPKPSAISQFFETPEDLARGVSFRVYLPKRMPDGVRHGKAYSLSNSNGSLYEVSLPFESYNSETQLWEAVASFWIQLHYPKPLPLWSEEPVETDTLGVRYDKVDFLPSPGLQLTTQEGFVYYWIENDIFYTLILEPWQSEAAAVDFINLLIPTR